MSEEGTSQSGAFHRREYIKLSKLLTESWSIFKNHIKTFSSYLFLPLLSLLLFAYLVYFIEKTDFQYSFWYTLLQFLSPLGFFFIFKRARDRLFQEIEEMKNIMGALAEHKDIQHRIKRSYLELPFFALIGYFFSISISIAYYSMFWFSFYLFFLTSSKEYRELFFKRRATRVKMGFWGSFLYAIIMVISIGVIVTLLPLMVWILDRGDVGVYLALFCEFLLQIFIFPISFLIFILFQRDSVLFVEIIYEPPSKREENIQKIAWILLKIVLIILSFFFLFKAFGFRDIPPVDDSDLRLSKVQIPKEQNAYYDFLEAIKRARINVLPEKLSAMLEGRANPKEMGDFLKRNEGVFPYIEMALRRPYFQSPNLEDPARVDYLLKFPEYSKLRELARLCVIRARYFFSQKKEKEAFDMLMNVVKMGQMIEDSPRPIYITYLVGRAIKAIGLRAMRKLVPKSNLPPNVLKEYSKRLLSYKESVEGMKRAMKMEYNVFLNSISQWEVGFANRFLLKEMEKRWGKEIYGLARETQNRWFYKPNKVRKFFLEGQRKFISNVGKLYKDMVAGLRGEEDVYLKPKNIYELLGENLLGRKILEITLFNIEPSVYQRCLGDFDVSSTAVLFALKAYKMEKGNLPDSLNELVPQYLPQLPIDPYDGKPLRYSKLKKIIFCLGRELNNVESAMRNKHQVGIEF